MSDPMAPILRALRAERETSPWWTRHAHWRPGDDEEPLPESVWDDSEVTTTRRRRELDRAAARMETIREDTA